MFAQVFSYIGLLNIWLISTELNTVTKILKIILNCNSNHLLWNWKANDLENHFCTDLQSLKKAGKSSENVKELVCRMCKEVIIILDS